MKRGIAEDDEHAAILRLHHEEPLSHPLHWSDQRPRASGEEHRSKLVPGFTSKYNITRLVYWEVFKDIRDAIAREKEIKGWRRSKKIALIESMNPHWDDLSC